MPQAPGRTEMPAIINRGDRDHRTNARQFGESAACFVRPAYCHELSVELIELAIEVVELVEHIHEDLAREIRQLCLFNGRSHLRREAPGALG